MSYFYFFCGIFSYLQRPPLSRQAGGLFLRKKKEPNGLVGGLLFLWFLPFSLFGLRVNLLYLANCILSRRRIFCNLFCQVSAKGLWGICAVNDSTKSPRSPLVAVFFANKEKNFLAHIKKSKRTWSITCLNLALIWLPLACFTSARYYALKD